MRLLQSYQLPSFFVSLAEVSVSFSLSFCIVSERKTITRNKEQNRRFRAKQKEVGQRKRKSRQRKLLISLCFLLVIAAPLYFVPSLTKLRTEARRIRDSKRQRNRKEQENRTK